MGGSSTFIYKLSLNYPGGDINSTWQNPHDKHMPSSVVSSIKYNVATSTLRIIFVSGRIYDYKGVPEEVVSAMKAAFSKGIYFNQYIKDHYRFEKIK